MVYLFFVRVAMSPKILDASWEVVVLAAIGETLDDGDEVCGIRCVDKVSRLNIRWLEFIPVCSSK